MRLKFLDGYRDGGTVEALFENGKRYFVDRRIATTTPGALYTTYPREGDIPIPADETTEVITALILAVYEARNAYKNERSAARQDLTTLEEIKAHKAEDNKFLL